MSAKQPSRFAIYLLETFAVSPALTGDLIERYARGRSQFWFWRQALAAVAINAFKEIRDHKLLFARAVLVYVLTVSVLAQILYRSAALIYGPVFTANELWLIGAVAYLAAGWMIGRLHRPFSGSMVVGAICVMWLFAAPRMLHDVSNMMQHERFRPYVYARFIVGIESTICLLIGGLLSASARSKHPRTPTTDYNPASWSIHR